MELTELLAHWPSEKISEYVAIAKENEIFAIIGKEILTEEDFAKLISPAALPFLEEMARRADTLTRNHFGNTILLFTPSYLSDYCENRCVYCAFAANHNHSRRHHLSLTEIEKEAAVIAETGMRHILILTGESPAKADIEYLVAAIKLLRKYFSSISIEIYPLLTDGYKALVEAGADLLTIYQETYNRKLYAKYHHGGPKADYDFRLNAPERALEAGFRAVTIGPLLGLSDATVDCFYSALHLDYLEKKFPYAELGISLPRIRPIDGGYQAPFPVDDRSFVQYLISFRLYKPHIAITVSTRESKQMRNALLRLGATKMSAGVSTTVGGHSANSGSGQFEISDNRTVKEMQEDLIRLGFQPVMHNWHHRLLEQ